MCLILVIYYGKNSAETLVKCSYVGSGLGIALRCDAVMTAHVIGVK